MNKGQQNIIINTHELIERQNKAWQEIRQGFDSKRINSNCKPKELFEVRISLILDCDSRESFVGRVFKNNKINLQCIDTNMNRLIATIEHEIYSVYKEHEVQIKYYIPISLQKFLEVK